MELRAPQLGDRSLFPDLAARAYLAHAAVSPVSSRVAQAVHRCLSDYAQRGVAAAIDMARLRADARALAAQLLHANSSEIGLVQSTSAGVIAIARSLPFLPKQRVIVFEGEFPANFTPWQLVARDLGLELVSLPLAAFLRSDEEGLALLRGELERGARLVAVSAVQFQTGLRMPLKSMAELCHAHGAELFVDAIQALGVVPLDVKELGIDYLAAGGHKFMMGLEGAGLLYVRNECLPALSLGLAGWTGHEDAFSFLMDDQAGQLRYDRPLVRATTFVEQGAVSMVGYAALSASLQMLLELGVSSIFDHVAHYLDSLEPALLALGLTSVRARERARQSAILAFKLPPGPALTQVARRLGEQGIVVSTPDGHLRLAPHFANHISEIPAVVLAVQRAL
ncbi:MAG: aminotransferase class V-fold PLP-dependent enzyme [Myxococcales bacterium]